MWKPRSYNLQLGFAKAAVLYAKDVRFDSCQKRTASSSSSFYLAACLAGLRFLSNTTKGRLGKVPESYGEIAVPEVLQESEFRN
jgi:hypothetical protein